MSTLRTDTLTNAAGTKSVPVNTVVDGSAKAWVNFNGTGTVAIRRSFNVTSITDGGVGNYTVNFASTLPTANYAVAFGTVGNTAGSAQLILAIYGTASAASNKSTTQLQLVGGSGGAGAFDTAEAHVVVYY